MNFDELMRQWDFGNQMMPHQLKITHLPTGLSLTGNCKHEQSKLRLERDLTDALAILVAKEEAENPSLIRKSAAEMENEKLRQQLEQMQTNIEKLLQNAAAPVKMLESVKGFHPEVISKSALPTLGRSKAKRTVANSEGQQRKGWSPEKRAAAAQRMKDRQAAKFGLSKAQKEAKIDTPAGEKTEEQLIREQMRGPTQAPQRLPKAHSSHGGTVVQVSPEAIAKGFKP